MYKSKLTKLVIIMFSILFGLSVSACAKEEEPVDEVSVISVDENEAEVELIIPESFPIDIIPIYPDSKLYSVVEVNKSFTIMFYSKDESILVADFYKNVFKDATNKMETNQSDSYTIYGELEGYTFTFDVSEDDDLEGYQTLGILSVVMNQK